MKTTSYIAGFSALLFLTAGFFIACSAGAGAKPEGPRKLGTRDSVKKGEYLITMKGKSSCVEIANIFEGFAIIKCKNIHGRLFLAAFEKDPGLEAITATGKKSGKVERVQPNFRYRAFHRKKPTLMPR